MRRSWLVIALMMIVAASLAVFAQQPTTGTLAGKVLDNEGKPLPGATIVIEGPLGERSTQTDVDGNFEFRFMPPGIYKVKAEMAGFSPVLFSKVGLTTGQITRLPVKLNPGKTEEVTVTSVTPLIDVKRSEVISSFKTDQAINTMPIGRNFVAAVAFAPGVVDGGGTGQGNYSIGGSSGLENSYIIDGVNITDSGYGGVGTYSLNYGSLGTGITSDFLEEVQVKTGGFEAEYGQALGGVISGIVRSGTNDIKGRVGVYVEPRSLAAQGKTASLIRGLINDQVGPQTTDIGLQAGGPFIKDRAFWFVAYNPVKNWNDEIVRTDDPRNPLRLADPTTSSTYLDPNFMPNDGQTVRGDRKRDNYAAKFNFVASANHRFELTAFGDPSKGYGNLGSNASSAIRLYGRADVNGDGTLESMSRVPADAAGGAFASTIDYGAHQQSLRYTGLFGSDWFVEAQINHRKNDFTETSTVNDFRFRDRRMVLDANLAPQPVVGGSGFTGPTTDKTMDYSLKITKTLGNHELKAGFQYFDLKYSAASTYSGPTFNVPFRHAVSDGEGGWIADTNPATMNIYVPTASGALVDVRGGYGAGNCDPTNPIYGVNCASDPIYRVTRARFNEPGETSAKDTALFIQDTWSITDKWTVKLGLRSSTQKLKGAGEFVVPIRQVAAGLFINDPQSFKPNSYDFDTEWSPRLGVTFDPLGNGKVKFYASAARYFERVPSDLAVRQFSNEFGVSKFEFTDPNLTTRRGTTGSPSLQGLGTTSVQPGTKLPYEDEYVVGWQQLVRPDLSVEVRGVFRKQGRVLEDVQFAVLEDIQNYYYGGVCVQVGANACAQRTTNPFPTYGSAPFGSYVLANPGENTEGPFGKPEREYKALEVQIEKRLSNHWAGFANYRYSRLQGNYEGLFRNDNGQSDPNITSLFDFPNSTLMRGQYQSGYLNNDRPHVLHVGGTYFFDSGVEVGGILNWQSGRPRTPMLAHPNYQNAGELPGRDPLYYSWDTSLNNGQGGWLLAENCPDSSYGCFLGAYTDAPRGYLGRMPDLSTIDLHFGYGRNIGKTHMKVSLDVSNLFNAQEVQNYNDDAETAAAVKDPEYLKILGYQQPRSVRLAVLWDW